jgi:hypothetical protein
MTGRMRPDFSALFAFCDLHASRVAATSDIRFYDRQGFPIPSDGVESPTLVWARRLEADPTARCVAEDDLPDGSRLSTVWLGLDHGGGGRPLFFETMRFAPLRRGQRSYSSLDFPDPETGEETEQLRYTSEEEARAAHHAILRRLRLGH